MQLYVDMKQNEPLYRVVGNLKTSATQRNHITDAIPFPVLPAAALPIGPYHLLPLHNSVWKPLPSPISGGPMSYNISRRNANAARLDNWVNASALPPRGIHALRILGLVGIIGNSGYVMPIYHKLGRVVLGALCAL